MTARVRDAVDGDAAAIVALNLESEAVLSPMDASRFSVLRAEAAYLRVIEDDGAVVAFLMAFRERAAYDSLNFRWFDARYDAFLYVDRVVVSQAGQGRGFGAMLYADLFAFARAAGVPRVTCEFDVVPRNVASERFHAKHGFVEVGTQDLPGGKRVSLQGATL